MAAPATSASFLELVRKSQLISAKKLDDYFSNSHAPLSVTPKELAAQLVRDGLLTNFQSEQLLKGKHKGFDIGKYRLLERIGQGGMGQVYLAQHVVMRRPVALKILPPKQAKCEQSRERFMREARAAGALTHPNIVRAYDVDMAHGLWFLVMEFVDGCSLQHLIATQGPLPPARAAYFLWQAAVGLQHAHEAGLVHRDIKPANLLLERTGIIKLLDLGLARFFADGNDQITKDERKSSILGTADFLAPEQAIDCHEVDIRGDIYALGVTGFYLLTGTTPFADGTTAQKLLAHQIKEPPSLQALRPEVGDELEAIIMKMMSKKPEERYQTPDDVVEALANWAADPPTPPLSAEMPPRCNVLSATAANSSQSGMFTKPAARSGLHSGVRLSKSQFRSHGVSVPATLLACVIMFGLGGAWSAGWLNGASYLVKNRTDTRGAAPTLEAPAAPATSPPAAGTPTQPIPARKS